MKMSRALLLVASVAFALMMGQVANCADLQEMGHAEATMDVVPIERRELKTNKSSSSSGGTGGKSAIGKTSGGGGNSAAKISRNTSVAAVYLLVNGQQLQIDEPAVEEVEDEDESFFQTHAFWLVTIILVGGVFGTLLIFSLIKWVFFYNCSCEYFRSKKKVKKAQAS